MKMSASAGLYTALAVSLAGCSTLEGLGLGAARQEPARQVEVKVPQLSALAGQTPEDIAVFLGPPAVDRTEGPSRLITYGTSACRLYLIFVSENEAPMTLSHVEMEAVETIPGAGMERLQACVAAVATDYQSGGAARPTSRVTTTTSIKV